MPNPLRLAFAGCGNISTHYAKSLRTRPERVRILGASDPAPGAAQALVDAGPERAKVYGSYEELLADPEVELVLNLTHAQAHYAISAQALRAGKHVHSEKPLACTRREARALVQLAQKKKRRLGCSPFTFLGELQQSAAKLLREGQLGKVRVVYAEMNHGRIETWHPNPYFFFQAGSGPLFDVGVYPLTILTAFFGPVRRVTGFTRTVMPRRVIGTGERKGKGFRVGTPDFVVGGLEFAKGGPVGRLTANFYVGPSRQHGIEIHGDKGSLILPSAFNFDEVLQYRRWGEEAWREVPHVKEPYHGVEWGRAVFDLAEAIRERRPHRATGAQAAHVVEICAGVLESAQKGRPVAVKSSFKKPAPMPWAM